MAPPVLLLLLLLGLSGEGAPPGGVPPNPETPRDPRALGRDPDCGEGSVSPPGSQAEGSRVSPLGGEGQGWGRGLCPPGTPPDPSPTQSLSSPMEPPPPPGGTPRDLPLPPHGDRGDPRALPPTHSPPEETVSPPPPGSDGLSSAERYLVALVAGLLLALCPVLGVAVLQCPLCHRYGRWLRPGLMGMAAGALSGDSVLHLLPEVLEVSGQEGGGVPGGPPWVLLGVLGGVLICFLLEKVVGILGTPKPGLPQEEVGAEPPPSPPQLQHPTPPAPLLLLARAAHSLSDGVALGVAFGTSWRQGTGTALALLCHELPHSTGMAAVLGSRWVLWVVLGGLVPLLPGVSLGVSLGGGSGTAQSWIRALSCGVLIYLGLGDMVPALVGARDPHPWVLLGVQSTGLLGGWALLLLLALGQE